uniref:Uncharacterized protein n=1 Tax=Rhizophora mucronata TaxID=61149 RepID=A0A2P2MYX8_RHIMU
MPSSRSRSLMNAMLPRNDKKQRLRSSPCKKPSIPGSRCKSFCRVAVFR